MPVSSPQPEYFLCSMSVSPWQDHSDHKKEPEIMGISPEHLEPVIKKGAKQVLNDVAQAQSFIKDIGESGKVNIMISCACEVLQRLFPHKDERHKQWTERRLRAWWNNESEHVLHWQMIELFQAAEKAKEERRLIQKARREHAEFIQKTARLAQMLEHQDEAFSGPQIEGLRRVVGRMDRAGNSRD